MAENCGVLEWCYVALMGCAVVQCGVVQYGTELKCIVVKCKTVECTVECESKLASFCIASGGFAKEKDEQLFCLALVNVFTLGKH